ncbi:aspartate-semialdehyde dehydrogenase [Paratissierella segnis]|uniref:Aspartate-semialdehyde dehydrogenase n=1 Tax=Paratissierella segnis TaxID=2763679 RepID=A0A926ILB5_9FIRM|nr:aspartate-semialdehyde dehydrogenase [Paratissierella segnis]MBC8589200.1 aspartate-semialdehyde dehydrogenase [Paratissierella segnis]
MSTYNIAIVGPMGAVGQEVAKILIERNFPIQSIKLLGTSANKGRKINFNDKIIYTKEAREGAFEGVDIAFFCVEAEISKILAPIAISEGAVIIDNSSAWRTEPDIPLIVPEVNSESLKNHKGLIANPNCSTIQMLVPLKPIHDKYKIKRIVVSTYQAVSGTGKNAIDELNTQAKAYVNEKEIANFVYPYQILFNAIPHIDSFIENGYTKEEMKMVNEANKILDKNIKVNATTVRIPVFRGHSESINIETELAFEIEDIKKLLKSSKGIAVIDDPKEYLYPMPLYATDTDDVYVGRIRKDFTVDNGLNMWVVADNLRKGAALNAVQIAETLIELKLL